MLWVGRVGQECRLGLAQVGDVHTRRRRPQHVGDVVDRLGVAHQVEHHVGGGQLDAGHGDGGQLSGRRGHRGDEAGADEGYSGGDPRAGVVHDDLLQQVPGPQLRYDW